MQPEPALTTVTPEWRRLRERGGRFMTRVLLWIARNTSRSITRALTLPPTVAWFIVTDAEARRVSKRYLSRVLGREAGLADVWHHIFTFASVTLDRILMALGGFTDLELVEDRDARERHVTYSSERGSLLFVSHLGSFEALRVVGTGRARMKFLLDDEHHRKLTSLLGTLSPELAATIIPAAQPGPALALAIRQALDEGYRVGMMVDRPRAGEKTVRVPFFGADAAFPAGPWALAAALQARVMLGFCVFRGGRTYEGHFELFTEKFDLPRAHRAAGIEQAVRRYAARLEHHAKSAPYNWFNFYDFWK
ncbi:MAG TPA: acyltransferase [Verrucomicrobiae bacterium]|nr:acyltransferase [Verrucomicrobiae bacterium]